MIQPLNYAPKAIVDIEKAAKTAPPASRHGLLYLAGKLREAQMFLLPDYGQLFDRSKPRPQVPTEMFRPPFSVTALEYTASSNGFSDPVYCAVASSRRIALAWDWQGDLIFGAALQELKSLGPGVVVASIAYLDAQRVWMPTGAAMHVSYAGAWQAPEPLHTSGFVAASMASGRISRAQATAPRLGATPIPLLPETIEAASRIYGRAQALDAMAADVADELNAYLDLCSALACRNVSMEKQPASAVLNTARRKSGKPPLFDYHVLRLADADMPAGSGGAGDRNAPRSHVRRGHIRRLAPDRFTWVNQTMVSGRGGFIDKTYSMGAQP